jgi:hypothetical protein
MKETKVCYHQYEFDIKEVAKLLGIKGEIYILWWDGSSKIYMSTKGEEKE